MCVEGLGDVCVLLTIRVGLLVLLTIRVGLLIIRMELCCAVNNQDGVVNNQDGVVCVVLLTIRMEL